MGTISLVQSYVMHHHLSSALTTCVVHHVAQGGPIKKILLPIPVGNAIGGTRVPIYSSSWWCTTQVDGAQCSLVPSKWYTDNVSSTNPRTQTHRKTGSILFSRLLMQEVMKVLFRTSNLPSQVSLTTYEYLLRHIPMTLSRESMTDPL